MATLDDVTYSPHTMNDEQPQSMNTATAAEAVAAAAEYRAAELGKDQLIDALDVPDGASYSTDDSYSENSEEDEEEEEDEDLSSDDDANANNRDQVAMMQLTSEQSTHPSQLNFNPHANSHSTANPLATQNCLSDYDTMYRSVTHNTASHQMMMTSCPVTQYTGDASSSLPSTAYAPASIATHASIQRDHGYSEFNHAQSTASFNQLHTSPPQVITSPSPVSLIDGNINNTRNSDGQGGHVEHSQQQVISYSEAECTFLSPSPVTSNYSVSR